MFTMPHGYREPARLGRQTSGLRTVGRAAVLRLLPV